MLAFRPFFLSLVTCIHSLSIWSCRRFSINAPCPLMLPIIALCAPPMLLSITTTPLAVHFDPCPFSIHPNVHLS